MRHDSEERHDSLRTLRGIVLLAGRRSLKPLYGDVCLAVTSASIQGSERTDASALAEVAPWLRWPSACTAMASPTILLLLVPVASLPAVFSVHPFDLIYNFGIRFVTGTSPLSRAAARRASHAVWERSSSPPGSFTRDMR